MTAVEQYRLDVFNLKISSLYDKENVFGVDWCPNDPVSSRIRLRKLSIDSEDPFAALVLHGGTVCVISNLL